MPKALLRAAMKRMLDPIFEQGVYKDFDLNPEDWDEVAGLMLCGLLGLDPDKYR